MESYKIEEALRRLNEAKKVSVDTETSGLDWRKNHIVGHVLAFGPWEADSYYLPVRHAPGGNIEGCSIPSTATGWDGSIHPLEQEIVKGLDRQGLHVVGHNLAFDLKFYNRIGLTKLDANFEDTMLNATLINEWQSSFSLDFCCKTYGVAQKKTSIYDYIAKTLPEARGQVKGSMAWFWKLRGDDPEAVDYAAGDGVSTWQLQERQLVQLELQNLMTVHRVECELIPVLTRMMVRGIKIDEERLHEVKKYLWKKFEDTLKLLPEGFNTRSNPQVKKLMSDSGFTNWPMTEPTKRFPEGNPSFPESWLVTNPIGQKIVDARKFSNLINSFIEPMITTHIWNGRVHPEYNQLRGDEYGTITGRLSSSNPNLQQVNKRNKELGKVHRSIFVADEGMLWGSADWSQIEPCLLAYYSRCQVLLDGFRAIPPVDPHQAVANATGFDREKGKRINQTLLTGGGVRALTTRYGMDPVEAKRSMEDYFEKMPEIKTLQKQAAYRMGTRGYIVSLLGRRARLADPNKDYVAVNRLLQCGNADCIKYKMVQIDKYFRSEGDDVHLLNNVHDALDYQFRPDREKIYKEALKIMTSFGEDEVICLDVPIRVDAKVGKDWSEATYGQG